MSHDLLILGASTRAAAHSAIQCGFHPRCADYFADRDLAALCPVHKIDASRGAWAFVEFALSIDPLPWLFTGGLESYPECLEQIASRHRLWGIRGNSLRAVRDPHRVADVLAQCGIPCPALRSDPGGLPRDGTWLKKPLASGGGRGIEPLNPQNDAGSLGFYFQEQINGPSYSAFFIGVRARAHLIGITRQLIGMEEVPYAYRGSIGPMPLGQPLASRLEALGNALACEFELAGWFGVDFVLRDGIPWPVEINPRYTASAEVHERALGHSLLPLHRLACEASGAASEKLSGVKMPTDRVIAKCIVHAPRRLVAPEIVTEQNETDSQSSKCSVADLPWPGTAFEQGEPVMTLLSEGSSMSECWSRMIGLERVWIERLGLANDERTFGALLSPDQHEGNDNSINA